MSLNISAAFDFLDHTRLLQKATEVIGLDDHVIYWLKSYLTDRSSYVSLGNCHSTTVGFATSVPQGSVLGLLLFSVFNNATADSSLTCVLGVTIEQHLTFSNHVTKIIQSCNNHILCVWYFIQNVNLELLRHTF